MLEARGLGISFGGHRAVDDVTCAFRPGELTAIVGPNGAGKTTLFNLLSGQLAPSAGSVLWRGRDISRLSPAARARLGIGRAFQLTNLFPALSVRENVRLVVQARRHAGMRMFGLAAHGREALAETDRVLDSCGLAGRSGEPASALPHGEQRKLEVAMLLAGEPAVFMFDEPTAGMSQDEVPQVIGLIERLRSQSADRIVLLVEHKIEVIFALASRIIVLHEGKLVADGKPREVMESDIVKTAYLGEAIEQPA